MFTIYYSNKQNLLNAIFAKIIARQPLRDPFASEIILTDNNFMAKWLQIELATQLGIAANINFLLPGDFIWQMFTLVLTDIRKEYKFTKSLMSWRIMTILPYFCEHPEAASIKAYLCNNNYYMRKDFLFADYIADVFKKYIIYRPDWLEIWQRGELIKGGLCKEQQRWQALLWNLLIGIEDKSKKNNKNTTNIYQNFIQTLISYNAPPPGLPNRVFIYGISSLPPMYLQVLRVLGYYIDIHFLLINPCHYYWGTVNSPAFLTQIMYFHNQYFYKQQIKYLLCDHKKKTNKIFNKSETQQIGNSLLLSYSSGYKRDNLYLLEQMDGISVVNSFIEPKGSSLLKLIQQDIFSFKNDVLTDINFSILNKDVEKRSLALKDKSLTIHVCHSMYREIEVLYDNILAMLSDDPTLHLRDFIVMAPAIDSYIPFIQAVFGEVKKGFHLSFSISSDKILYHNNPIIIAFLSILEFPYNRFTGDQILSLLDVPSLATRFAIDKQGVQLLRKWIVESGIRWGLDDNIFYDLQLTPTKQNTWHFGLQRMLLGYAMDSDSGEMWEGIIPYNEPDKLMANLIGHLAELLAKLRYWYNKLSQPKSLNDWLMCAIEIIEDFFLPDTEEEESLIFLKNQWYKMLQSGIQAGYDKIVHIKLLYNKLIKKLYEGKYSDYFMDSNSINFCTLTLARLIPCKVVCLLGMNNEVNSQVKLSINFNLMLQQYRCGDPTYYDSKYLFLEALISAEKKLYISFIGYSIKNNVSIYPPAVIKELSDYIIKNFYLKIIKCNTTKDSNCDIMKNHLWYYHSSTPFVVEKFLQESKFQSFSSDWLPAVRCKDSLSFSFFTTLINISYQSVSLSDIIKFYRNPVRFWFEQRLGVYFYQPVIKSIVSENFVIDGIDKYQMNDWLLNSIINGKKDTHLFQQAKAAGKLPYGAFGELCWNKQYQEMIILYKIILNWYLPERYNIDISITLDNNINFFGCLSQVQVNGLLRWRPCALSIIDGLQLWIEHLSYCAMGGTGNSRMLGTQGKWHFAPLPVSKAKELLSSLILGYCQGINAPLLLLPRLSEIWINNCFDNLSKNINYEEKQQQLAYHKLMQAWRGDYYVSGENKDFYLQRLIYEINEKHIKAIMLAAEKYLLPPLIFNLALS